MFTWQPQGALGGRTPNQLNSLTPQNNEGLGVGGGQAMFNLPRFQMPGSTIGFGGSFGPGQQQAQPGGVPGSASVGNVRFSISRQASSDPVQNIINDIQNPMGGMNINFGQGGQAPAPQKRQPPILRDAMTGGFGSGEGGGLTAGQPTGPGMDNAYGRAMALQKQFGVAGTNLGQPSSYQGDGTYGSFAGGLRKRMTAPYSLGEVFL
jgi:hypothetical protein